MKNKKGLAIRFMILLALGAITFLILAIMMPNLLRKGGGELSGLQDESGDYGSDGVANFYDKCKCIRAETDNGCPNNIDPELDDHNPYDNPNNILSCSANS